MSAIQIAARLGNRGALKRGLIGAMLIVMMLSVLMAHYALSSDVESSIYDQVKAGNYIDTGLDKTHGIKMDLVEKGLTHKVLEFEITSEISSQEIRLLIAENNFDANAGTLSKLAIAQREEPIYETLCNPYTLPEDPINHSVSTIQNCTTIQIGTRNVDVEEWLPVELKSAEKADTASLSTFNILGKGRYRYSFDTPIIQTASGWGNAGTVFLKVGSNLFADKQHSSWWNTSCGAKIGATVTPQITDNNMQFYINTSTNIDFTKAYVIRNDTNATLSFYNDTGKTFFTNMSVIAGTKYGIEVYYNCSAQTPQYNVTQVMLESRRFETTAEITNFGGCAAGLNTTNVKEGIGSIMYTDAETNCLQATAITYYNASFVGYFYTDSLAPKTKRLGVGTVAAYTWTAGQTPAETTYYISSKPGVAMIPSTVPISIGWHKFKWTANATNVTLFIDDIFVEIAPYNTYIANYFDAMFLYSDVSPGSGADLFYVYKDFGTYNPTYAIEEPQTYSPNTAPSIEMNAIFPAIAYTNDDLNCSFTLTDSNIGDSLSANVSWYKDDEPQFSFNISVINGTLASNILYSLNTTKGETWKCSVIAYDGKLYSNASSAVRVISNSEPVIENYNASNSTYVSNTSEVTFPESETENITFAVNMSDADEDTLWYSWFVDDVLDPLFQSSWFEKTFDLFSAGLHIVRVDINDSSNAITTQAWNVNIANVVNKFWSIDYVSPTPANGANLTSQSATISVAVTPSVITEATVKTLFHDTETDFDGTHNFTEFNTTSDAVQLSYANMSGTYTSNVYNAEEVVSWDNITWSEFLPTDGELQPQNNLVSLWHMNNNWLDSSGYNNNGTAYGAVFSSERQLGSHAGSFDGSNDHVDCGNSALFDFSLASNFSISVWIKTTDTDGIIVSKMGAGPQYRGYSLMIYQGYLYMPLISDNGANNYLAVRETATGTLTDNQWHHVAISYDGSGQASGLKMYIDGDAIATTALSNSLTGSTLTSLPLWIGERSDGSFDFSGLIDEVAIWNRTLSAVEVEDLMHQPIADLKLQVRSCDDSACDGEEFVGPSGDEGQYFSNPSFNDISFLNNSQWFQYKAFFETNNVDFPSSLYSVTVKAHTEGEIEDVSINNAWIDLNGNIYAMSGSGLSWSYVNSTLAPDTYIYRVYVNDTFGNINPTPTRTFTVPSYEIVFNVTSGEDGGVLNNVQITCDYSGFNQGGDITNMYGSYVFPIGGWSCNFDKYLYYSEIIPFSADADKILSVKLSLIGDMTTEEHNWLESIYNCLNSGDCTVYNLLQTINKTTDKIWQQYLPTDISVVAQEVTLSNTLSTSSNISINYTLNVPFKEGYNNSDLLPIMISFWFTDVGGKCYNQDKQTGTNRAETPYCIPLIAQYLGPNNGTTSFKVDLRPNLPSGTYNLVRSIDIDPPVNGKPVWINYGRAVIGSITVDNPVATELITEEPIKSTTVEGKAPPLPSSNLITGMAVDDANNISISLAKSSLMGLAMICLTLLGMTYLRKKP